MWKVGQAYTMHYKDDEKRKDERCVFRPAVPAFIIFILSRLAYPYDREHKAGRHKDKSP